MCKTNKSGCPKVGGQKIQHRLSKKLKASKVFLPSILVLALSITSCKKFVDIDPSKTEITTEIVFMNDPTAVSAINGIYSEMVNSVDFASGGSQSVTFLSSLSSDEMNYLFMSQEEKEFNINSLVPDNGNIFSLWEKGYRYIYFANSVLKGLANSSGVSTGVKNQLVGEAKFIRAFCYFYLVNLFGDIPLITTTTVEENLKAFRISKDLVYQQIIDDLVNATQLLSDNYSFSDGNRIRANKFAAHALLARVYLYSKDWAKAEIHSSIVINNTATYSLLVDLNDVFLTNSSEAIWQLASETRSARDGQTFIISSSSLPSEVSQVLSNQMLNAFEIGDKRRMYWVDSVIISGTSWHFPFKYKTQADGQPINDYTTILRLSEQYLIRAEARVQQSNISGAQADLNAIRQRAGLDITSANDNASLLLAIEQERRVEFFTEWGHRWLDLKRIGKADVVLASVKVGWQPTDVLYPIPQNEIDVNKNLTQNSGY